MDFAPLLAAIALIWKLVDFAKHVRVRDMDAIVAQVAVWAAGIAVLFLLRETDFAGGVDIADTSLASLNWASVVLVGLTVGSTASAAYDFKRAVDNHDSAAQPSLVTGRTPVTVSPNPYEEDRRTTINTTAGWPASADAVSDARHARPRSEGDV